MIEEDGKNYYDMDGGRCMYIHMGKIDKYDIGNSGGILREINSKIEEYSEKNKLKWKCKEVFSCARNWFVELRSKDEEERYKECLNMTEYLHSYLDDTEAINASDPWRLRFFFSVSCPDELFGQYEHRIVHNT